MLNLYYRQLIYMVKSTSTKTFLWGTPHITLIDGDLCPFRTTHCAYSSDIGISGQHIYIYIYLVFWMASLCIERWYGAASDGFLKSSVRYCSSPCPFTAASYMGLHNLGQLSRPSKTSRDSDKSCVTCSRNRLPVNPSHLLKHATQDFLPVRIFHRLRNKAPEVILKQEAFWQP